MIQAKSYAAQDAQTDLAPWSFERREVGPHDVQFDILFCGVCHSDLHQIKNDWFPGIFPMVPGHEIVGRVVKVGDHVKNFKVGDLAGTGCMVDLARFAKTVKRIWSSIALTAAAPKPTIVLSVMVKHLPTAVTATPL
jgi:uncharacterized zinc-type alcohol dehydrogenase-like protein